MQQTKTFLIFRLQKDRHKMSLIEHKGNIMTPLREKEIIGRSISKQEIQKHMREFLKEEKVDKKIILGGFYLNEERNKKFNFDFSKTKFNGITDNDGCGIDLIDHKEIFAISDFNGVSSFFEFNGQKFNNHHGVLIVTIGNHLQTFEKYLLRASTKITINRVRLDMLNMSPINDRDDQFIRRESDSSLKKYKDILTKKGFIDCYVFQMSLLQKEVSNEVTLNEILKLIKDKDEVAVKTAEYFIEILAHFLYSCLILTLPNKELRIVSNFLCALVKAMDSDKHVKELFMKNLIMSQHIRHRFESLNISIHEVTEDLLNQTICESF